MMIHAYQEIYLSKAMAVMGEAFNYAVNDCKISGDDFIKMFLGSTICKKIENGEVKYLVGISGVELVRDIIFDVTNKTLTVKPIEYYNRSREYWAGFSISYYQWYSNRKYSQIFKVISFTDLLCMYETLHEADITKFVDIIDNKIKEEFKDTNLKRIRNIYGCSQNELSQMSGVSLRSIQMYEQRKKDINKASVITVYALAKALGCEITDLIENY